jgi:hypothetical protein
MQEAAITFLETVDLHSLNLAPLQEEPVFAPVTPAMQRTTSSSSTPSLKRRAPSLPIDSADPLNALPSETNESALKSIAGTLEGSYKLLWSKVQLVDPPKTIDDVRRLISRPFQADEAELKEKPDINTTGGISRLIVGSGIEHKTPSSEDTGRGNLMYVLVHCNLIVEHLDLEHWAHPYPDLFHPPERRHLRNMC